MHAFSVLSCYENIDGQSKQLKENITGSQKYIKINAYDISKSRKMSMVEPRLGLILHMFGVSFPDQF